MCFIYNFYYSYVLLNKLYKNNITLFFFIHNTYWLLGLLYISLNSLSSLQSNSYYLWNKRNSRVTIKGKERNGALGEGGIQGINPGEWKNSEYQRKQKKKWHGKHEDRCTGKKQREWENQIPWDGECHLVSTELSWIWKLFII